MKLQIFNLKANDLKVNAFEIFGSSDYKLRQTPSDKISGIGLGSRFS